MAEKTTYTALHERIYDGSDTGDAFLATQDMATRTAWVILRNLDRRGGFDHWFDDIDADLQDEIFEEIRASVETALPSAPAGNMGMPHYSRVVQIIGCGLDGESAKVRLNAEALRVELQAAGSSEQADLLQQYLRSRA